MGAFDLPAFVPEVIRRHYRSKSWSALLPKWYDEPRVSEYMEGLRGELYVDVGASFGYYLRKLSSNFRRMIAIEADPSIFKFLQENAPPNCTPVNLAVADEVGISSFHVPAGQYNFGVGSLLPLSERAAWVTPTAYRTFKVKASTLDALLSSEPQVDLVKVDVEGAENLVLNGAANVMERIERWLIEIHNHRDVPIISRMMRRSGYTTKQLDERHYVFERGRRS